MRLYKVILLHNRLKSSQTLQFERINIPQVFSLYELLDISSLNHEVQV